MPAGILHICPQYRTFMIKVIVLIIVIFMIKVIVLIIVTFMIKVIVLIIVTFMIFIRYNT